MPRKPAAVCTETNRALVRLSPVEVDHLLTLLHDARREGNYYGPRDFYWKRHDRLVAKLDEVRDVFDEA